MNNGGSGDPTFSLPPTIPSIDNPNYHSCGPSADSNGDGKPARFGAEWGSVLGTPAAVQGQLEALAARGGVEGLVVLSITPEVESRLRCYGLLAEAFGLVG